MFGNTLRIFPLLLSLGLFISFHARSTCHIETAQSIFHEMMGVQSESFLKQKMLEAARRAFRDNSGRLSPEYFLFNTAVSYIKWGNSPLARNQFFAMFVGNTLFDLTYGPTLSVSRLAISHFLKELNHYFEHTTSKTFAIDRLFDGYEFRDPDMTQLWEDRLALLTTRLTPITVRIMSIDDAVDNIVSSWNINTLWHQFGLLKHNDPTYASVTFKAFLGWAFRDQMMKLPFAKVRSSRFAHPTITVTPKRALFIRPPLALFAHELTHLFFDLVRPGFSKWLRTKIIKETGQPVPHLLRLLTAFYGELYAHLAELDVIQSSNEPEFGDLVAQIKALSNSKHLPALLDIPTFSAHFHLIAIATKKSSQSDHTWFHDLVDYVCTNYQAKFRQITTTPTVDMIKRIGPPPPLETFKKSLHLATSLH